MIVWAINLNAQTKVLDKVIAVVGKNPVLLSDIEGAMAEQEKNNMPLNKCQAFEAIVLQKLLIAQAERDSVVVNDNEVEQEMSKRMSYFINQFGSEEKLEEFYGKRINIIKDELRQDVKEQLVSQKMRGKIIGDTKLTPAEVRLYSSSVPQDSLPLVNSEVELQQIVIKPRYSEDEKLAAHDKLENIRKQVLNGEKSIAMMARLYSEDPGSAKDGGVINNVTKGMMVPEFESVAFRLKTGEISNVFETPYGYHFIQLIKRKGELLDLRHILIMPKLSNADVFRAKLVLDTIYNEIKENKISFENAARKYSEDKDTKQNGGLMINQATASTKFDMESITELDKNLVITLNSMELNDFSKPMQFHERDGKPAYRLVRLKNRIDPHRANIKDDYPRLLMMATAERNKKILKEWIHKRSKITYMKFDSEYSICKFPKEWVISTINN
ncbi:MAG: peptidylprolyl isomerase [Bacteroidetes bacterium]|nr:peptidylprolyl isomerase [Bacteroidota bacterium]